MKIETVNIILDKKNLLLDQLVELLGQASDRTEIHTIADAMVYNFRGREIVQALVSKIETYELSEAPGGLVHFASECPTHHLEDYFLLWIKVVITGSYQAALNAYGILSSFDEPDLKEEQVELAEKMLTSYDKSDDARTRIVNDLLKMFE